MKNFENYECDGQMELFDFLDPQSCCGVTPWLHKTKCVNWDYEKPQTWQAYYICPKCYKMPVDEDGWPLYARGVIDEARQKATTIWNDPDTKFEIDEFTQKSGIRLHRGYGEVEEWGKLYNMDMEDFVGCSVRLD